MKDCIETGTQSEDRTGVGTKGIYGAMMKFDLSDGQIPLFTTKKVFWRAVVEELLWFISGETDSYVLEDSGINIWQGNTSREFLDRVGLHDVPEGDIGTGYGFQWRNWNGDYRAWIEQGERTGVDQFANLLDGLKSDPNSRRHVLTAWNVSQIKGAALPPCHAMSTFKVLGGKLHCTVLCRSQDLFLGTPFNVASYALLTHMIAKLHLGIEAGSLTWFGSDVHVYNTHFEQCREQMTREPYKFPTVDFEFGDSEPNIFSMTNKNIVLKDYKSYSSIKAEMVI